MATDPIQHWIFAQVEKNGLRPQGEISTVQTNPTANIFRLSTDQGALYAKIPIPPFAYEARLTAQLAAWFPANLPGILALEPDKGWFLMWDAGRSVKAMLQNDPDMSHWEHLLRQYAVLQQEAIPRIDTLLSLGIPDRRLIALPRLYDQLLADSHSVQMFRSAPEDSLTDDQITALKAFSPHLRVLCNRLSAYAIPETIHHDDFHVGNVTLRGEDYVFLDWVESCIAHPFFSLMLSLRYAKLVFLQESTILDHLRDVYLSCWLDFEPLARLREAFAIAQQIAAFCRALTWHLVALNVAEQDRAKMMDGAPYWLITFLNNAALT